MSGTTEAGAARVTAQGGGAGKRITDLGMGPVEPLPQKTDDKAALTMATGEVVALAPKIAEAKPIVRKIILDPAIPEDEGGAGGVGWVKWAVIGAGLAVASVAVALTFKHTGHRRRYDEVVATNEKAAARKPVVEPIGRAPGVAAGGAGGPRILDERSADPKVARTGIVLEERWADPKVARALPTELPTLLSACRQAFTEKRARDAEIACLAAKDAGPDSAEANALLGHALFGRKKRREALQAAERAVELDPRQADAYVIIGSVKQSTGDKAAATAAYRKYLELRPNGQYAADLRAIVESP
jgi:hypothetical protein